MQTAPRPDAAQLCPRCTQMTAIECRLTFCRITAASRLFAKSNYFPLFRVKTPAEAAAELSQKTGGVFRFKNHYIPVLLCSKGDSRRKKKTKVHKRVEGWRYVRMRFDAAKHEHLLVALKKRTCRLDGRFAYKVEVKETVMVLDAELEQAARYGDIADITIADHSDRAIVRLRNGDRFPLDCCDLENETDQTFEGQAATTSEYEKNHHYGRATMAIAHIFELKEKAAAVRELERLQIEAKRRKQKERQWKSDLNRLIDNLHTSKKRHHKTEQSPDFHATIPDLNKTLNVPERFSTSLENLPNLAEINTLVSDHLMFGNFTELFETTGLLLEIEGQSRFIVGQTVQTATGPIFIPGQTFQTETELLYIPGITVNLDDTPAFVAGVIFGNDNGGAVFLPGQTVIGEDGRMRMPEKNEVGVKPVGVTCTPLKDEKKHLRNKRKIHKKESPKKKKLDEDYEQYDGDNEMAVIPNGVDSSLEELPLKPSPEIANHLEETVNGHPVVTNDHSVVTNGHPVVTNGHPVVTNGHPVVTNGHAVVTNGHPAANHPELTNGLPELANGHAEVVEVPELPPLVNGHRLKLVFVEKGQDVFVDDFVGGEVCGKGSVGENGEMKTDEAMTLENGGHLDHTSEKQMPRKVDDEDSIEKMAADAAMTLARAKARLEDERDRSARATQNMNEVIESLEIKKSKILEKLRNVQNEMVQPETDDGISYIFPAKANALALELGFEGKAAREAAKLLLSLARWANGYTVRYHVHGENVGAGDDEDDLKGALKAAMAAAVEVFCERPRDLETGMRAAGRAFTRFIAMSSDPNNILEDMSFLVKESGAAGTALCDVLRDLTKKLDINKAETLRSTIRERYHSRAVTSKVKLVIEDEGDILVRGFTNLSQGPNDVFIKDVHERISENAGELESEKDAARVAHRAIVDAVRSTYDRELKEFLQRSSSHEIGHLLLEARILAQLTGMHNEYRTLERILNEDMNDDCVGVNCLAADQVTLGVIRRALVMRKLAERSPYLGLGLANLRKYGRDAATSDDGSARELVLESGALVSHACPVLSSMDIPSFLFELGDTMAMEDFLVRRIKSGGALLISRGSYSAVVPREASRFVLSGLVPYTLIDDKGITNFRPMHVFNALKMGKDMERRYHQYSCVGAFDKYAYTSPYRRAVLDLHDVRRPSCGEACHHQVSSSGRQDWGSSQPGDEDEEMNLGPDAGGPRA